MTFLHPSFKNLSCTFCVIFVVFCLCLRCNFVNFRGWHLQISVIVYIFLLGSVFSSLTSSETSLSITRPCYLCCYVPDGLYPLKPRLRFRFLGYIRRLSKKKQKNKKTIKQKNKNKKTWKKRENSRHFTNGLMAWHRDSVHLYSDKARCFNQSGRALYRNFIIIINKVALTGSTALYCDQRYLGSDSWAGCRSST